MPRIRTVKPEFFSSRDLSRISPHARLLAIGLLTLADKNGNLEWIPMQVHGTVFPWEERLSIHDLLDELCAIDWTRRYSVSGRDYVQITTFREHQRISGKEAESPAKHPEPLGFSPEDAEEACREAPGCFPEKHLDASPGAPDLPEYLNAGKGKGKGNVTPRAGARASRSRSLADLDGFTHFWERYPRKVGKAAAEKAWRKLKPDKALQAEILAGLDRYRLSGVCERDGGEYVKHPGPWLNDKRWEDEHAPRNGNGAAGPPLSKADAAEARRQAERAKFLGAAPSNGAIDGEWTRD